MTEASAPVRIIASLPPIVLLGTTGAGAMLVPAGYAAAGGDAVTARIFGLHALIFLTLLTLIAIASRRPSRPAKARIMLMTMLATYLVIPVMLALPLAAALPDTGLFNAWWEMVSCLTTTGASLYSPDRLADPLHLWRMLVGWLGGLYILIAALAIMSPLRIGGFEIMTSPFDGDARFPDLPGSGPRLRSSVPDQVAGIGHDAPARRLTRAFTTVFPVYAALTGVLWVLLTMAGDTGLVALGRAMGTLSTSGIAPVARPTGIESGRIGEAIVLIFLIPALSRRFWPGGGELIASERLRDDPELRLAASVIGLVTVALFLRHFVANIEMAEATHGGLIPNLASAARTAWGGLFTGVSFLTTTGWTALDWEDARSWSGLTSPGLMLTGLAMMGGGIATAAGGVKLLRVYALARQSRRELERMLHPSSISGSGRASRRLRREGAYLAFIFFMLFAVSIAVTVMLVSIREVNLDSATILSVAALTNTGQLAGSIPLTPVLEGSAGLAGAPWDGWAGLPVFTKAVLAGAMILGRVETLAVLALLSPEIWRR